jgi:D-psicose/D-tagatose/L-ribulose 3-epimerase
VVDDLGLGCSTVTVMDAAHNPVSPDASARQAAVDWLKWAIDMTAQLGGDVLCGPLHSALGVFSGTGPTADEKSRAVDVLRRAAEHAQQAKVRLAVEYLNRFESYFLTTVAGAVELVKRVDHLALGMMHDTFHAHIEEKSAEQAIAVAAKHIIHVHISENDRGVPGTGQVNWPASFAALKKIKYDGWLTIEAFGRALPELAAATRVWRDLFGSGEEVCREGLKFMRKMWS